MQPPGLHLQCGLEVGAFLAAVLPLPAAVCLAIKAALSPALAAPPACAADELGPVPPSNAYVRRISGQNW